MADSIQQAAAIPVLGGRVGMVTSSNGRRWVFPKGNIDGDDTPAEAAAKEAWEEAGLVGVIDPTPVGVYAYWKYGGERTVTVFRLDVADVKDRWPEKGLRRREWVTVEEALERVEEEGLRDVVRRMFAYPAVAAG